MEARVGKSYHVQVAIRYLYMKANSGESMEGLFERDGEPVSHEECLAELDRLYVKGFRVVPCGCPGSEAPPGRCPGWNIGDPDPSEKEADED